MDIPSESREVRHPGALRALGEQTWLVSKYKDRIREGHKAYLWEAGENAGIVATAHVITDPSEIPTREEEKPFIRSAEKFDGIQTRVVLRIGRMAQTMHVFRSLTFRRGRDLRIIPENIVQALGESVERFFSTHVIIDRPYSWLQSPEGLALRIRRRPDGTAIFRRADISILQMLDFGIRIFGGFTIRFGLKWDAAWPTYDLCPMLAPVQAPRLMWLRTAGQKPGTQAKKRDGLVQFGCK